MTVRAWVTVFGITGVLQICAGCNGSTGSPPHKTQSHSETALHPDKALNIVIEGIAGQTTVTKLSLGEPLLLRGRGDLGDKFVMYSIEPDSLGKKSPSRQRAGYQIEDIRVEMPLGDPVVLMAMFFEIDLKKKRTIYGKPAMPLAAVDTQLRQFRFDGFITAPAKAGNYELVVTLFEPPPVYDPHNRNDARLGTPFPVWRHVVSVVDDKKD